MAKKHKPQMKKIAPGVNMREALRQTKRSMALTKGVSKLPYQEAKQIFGALEHAEAEVNEAKTALIEVDHRKQKLEAEKARLEDLLAGKTPRTPAVYEALEEQLKQLRFYSTPSNLPFISLDYLDDKIIETQGNEAARVASAAAGKRLAEAMTETLNHAEPYFVSGDIVDLLVNSLDSFPGSSDVRPDRMPTPCGFVLLEKGLQLPFTPHGLDFPLHAFAWAPGVRPDDRGATVFFLLGPIKDASGKVGPYQKEFPWIPVNQAFGELKWTNGLTLDEVLSELVLEHERKSYEFVDRERTTIIAKFICGLVHFMGQRFVTLQRNRAPRAVARRFEHERKVEEAPLIRTIMLRAPAHRESSSDGTGSRWTVRSVRRAHWHSYWCGGGSDRCLSPGHKDSVLETRFLLATVCGPDGAPLKTRTNIYAVVR